MIKMAAKNSCMKYLIALSCLLCVSIASADVLNMPAGQTSLELVPVGNPGNANDPNTGSLYGGVPYNYSIGKYDVTVGQYTAFLNAVAASDPYVLYTSYMTNDLNIAGISRSGVSGSYTYNVIGSANHPIAYVTWGDAARFVNWLSNGQPTGSEGVGTTETGSYTLNGQLNEGPLDQVARNANATWVIPNESEWYKAAYYDPTSTNPLTKYNEYPSSSHTAPTSTPPGSTPNTANFKDINTGYAVTGTRFTDQSQNYLTDVGAYTASASPYGAFDMVGDLNQFNEGHNNSRFARGGSWKDSAELRSSDESLVESLIGRDDTGFRVAFVPEPSTFVLGVFAALMVGGLRLRF